MTIKIKVDKWSLIKSVLYVLGAVAIVGAYRYGYNRGLQDMATYVQQYMQQQQAQPQQESARPGSDPFHELPGSSL